jgi:hypothetical protein
MINSSTISTIPQSPAEDRARIYLKGEGYQFLMQIDWLCFKDGQWTVFEIKERELYQPDSSFPFYGSGLDLRQLWLREQLRQSLGLRCYLLVYEKNTTNIYGQFLDELNRKGGYIDTKNFIRIYPIESFEKLN